MLSGQIQLRDASLLSYHHQFWTDRSSILLHLNAEEFLTTRTRVVWRCIGQCSKPHCACAQLQGMRLFLENDVILK